MASTYSLRRTPEQNSQLVKQIAAAVIARAYAEKLKRESEAVDEKESVAHLGPVEFCEKVLGVSNWETAKEIMDAIDKPMAKVAVASCHASSKTFTAAQIILWWVSTGGICVSTAPTDEQLDMELWGEIRKLYAVSKIDLGGKLLPKGLQWYFGPDQYAIGRTPRDGISFQGTHGERVLIVLDEANGVIDSIWEAIEGIRAGGDVRILALANPTVAHGPFYDAFTRNRASWQTFVIDAFTTPNFRDIMPMHPDQMTDNQISDFLISLSPEQLMDNKRPYLITRHWVKEKLIEWGTDSAIWQGRVRGQFPQQASDALISLAWLNKARTSLFSSDEDTVGEYAGIDVAGPGEDETALCVFKGKRMRYLNGWREPDPRGKVVYELNQFNNLKRINVDSAGIGWHFYLHIKDQFPRVSVVPINVGEKPTSEDAQRKFVNLKSELYWNLRGEFQGNEINGLTDDLAISQLASIRYRQLSNGKTEIVGKEEMRKLYKASSPDRAECIMLARAKTGVKYGVIAQSKAKGWMAKR